MATSPPRSLETWSLATTTVERSETTGFITITLPQQTVTTVARRLYARRLYLRPLPGLVRPQAGGYALVGRRRCSHHSPALPLLVVLLRVAWSYVRCSDLADGSASGGLALRWANTWSSPQPAGDHSVLRVYPDLGCKPCETVPFRNGYSGQIVEVSLD